MGKAQQLIAVFIRKTSVSVIEKIITSEKKEVSSTMLLTVEFPSGLVTCEP